MKPYRAYSLGLPPFRCTLRRAAKKNAGRPSGIRRANIVVGANRWPNIGRVCRRISHSIGYFIPARRRRHRRRESHPRENSGRNGTVGFIALAKRLTFSSWARLSSTSCTPCGGAFDSSYNAVSVSRLCFFFFSRATVEFSPCANAIRCRVADRSSDDRSHRSSLMQFTLASLSTFPEERSAFNGSNSSPVYIYFRKTALARINNARFSFTQP